MNGEYIKRALKTSAASDALDAKVRAAVAEIIAAVAKGGEAAAREYGRKFDGWEGDIVVDKKTIAAAKAETSREVIADIEFAREQVIAFTRAQREHIAEFETELSPGVFAGQKLIPLAVAGCYVPGGRYAHIASAVMSVASAKAAGVEYVVAASAPTYRGEGDSAPQGVHPEILCALDLCGADCVLSMGGAQAVAAMALGLFSKRPAEIIAGPGNRFVAEAKRALFGRVGIDLFAGPTEILIIADKAADANIIAADLAAQAEHGADSPCWLIVTDRALGEKVAALMPGLIKDLPPRSQEAATAAWRDCGEIVFCENIAAAAEVANEYAAEHLEIHTAANDELIPRLKNYGALFIGEEASVAHGDKCSGPNHILPTRAAARYTGGLGVHKFLKVVTTQKMSREASVRVGEIASRLSRREGMEAHARSIDERVAKYKGE